MKKNVFFVAAIFAALLIKLVDKNGLEKSI